jgi:hypothetical protein
MRTGTIGQVQQQLTNARFADVVACALWATPCGQSFSPADLSVAAINRFRGQRLFAIGAASGFGGRQPATVRVVMQRQGGRLLTHGPVLH